MISWGINALNHGSSLAVFDDETLVSNKFSPSYTLDDGQLQDALLLGKPNRLFWYERPWVKKLRQLRAGQWNRVFDLQVLPSVYLNSIGVHTRINYTPHHASHAAAGYYTSPFDDCAIVVLDAIGEFECASIWKGSNNTITKLWSRNYPNSLGLFYSAFTDLLGFIPIKEEFKLQQLAETGNENKFYFDIKKYFDGVVSLNTNFHKGVRDWPELKEEDKCHIAAAVQKNLEEQIGMVMTVAKSITGSTNLVYMGGVAMNSRANKKQVETKFQKIWSLPQPGDPSSSIGAVLYHSKHKISTDLGVVKHIDIRV